MWSPLRTGSFSEGESEDGQNETVRAHFLRRSSRASTILLAASPMPYGCSRLGLPSPYPSVGTAGPLGLRNFCQYPQ
jgi:hypothetical protein